MKRATSTLVYLPALVVCFLLSSGLVNADTIYVSCLSTVERFDSSGNGSVFASGLDWPLGVAFDNGGNLYVANYGAQTIMKFDPSGNGSIFANSDLNFPRGLAFDKSGNLYVGNLNNQNIVKFDPSGHGSVFAGPSSGISGVTGIAFDSSGNLYEANEFSQTVRKFDPSASEYVFADLGSLGVTDPMGLAFDRSGNLYVAGGLDNQPSNNTIIKITTNGIESVFASSGLDGPMGLAFDSSGNLYVANYLGGTIEEFDTNGIGTVFASGLTSPRFIAVQVPEPATWILVMLGAVALLYNHQMRCRPS